MSELEKISFEEESEEIKDKVISYWTKRSESFSEQRHDEIHSYKRQLWQAEFLRYFSKEDKLSVLDVGCGTGYFEMVLSDFACQVTGIDLTPDMIERGRDLLKRHDSSAKLMVMDAEHPDFPDESFDVVVSRNLTWTLPHPIEAYKEWQRVLKPGGILLIYDAEYAKGFHHYNQEDNLAHKKVSESMDRECHEIYHMLTISSLDRPQWDKEVLAGLGFENIETDLGAGDRLYGEKDEFYMPDRMFLIKAQKSGEN